jgi:hypothetical protein
VGSALDRPWLGIFGSHRAQDKRQNRRLSGTQCQ